MSSATKTTTTSTDYLAVRLAAMAATRVKEARAILNESPSATPSGAIGTQNENGVTVNIVGIGVGFVGGALSLIALTLITKLFIARRRARENGTPRPQLWDIVFDGGTNQGRLAIGRSLGGWDYGMDIWSTRGGVGLWGLATGGGNGGEPLGEKPRLTEVVLGKSEQVSGEVKEWKPTTTFLHSSTPIDHTTDSKPTLQPSSIISTAVLILLPTPDTPWPLPLPPTITTTKSVAGEMNDPDLEGKKPMVQHIEDTAESRYWNRVNETLGEDGQAVGVTSTTAVGSASPEQTTNEIPGPPLAEHHESALDDDELEDLPDFVVGVLRMVLGEDEVAGSSVGLNGSSSVALGKVDGGTAVSEALADKPVGGARKGFFGR